MKREAAGVFSLLGRGGINRGDRLEGSVGPVQVHKIPCVSGGNIV